MTAAFCAGMIALLELDSSSIGPFLVSRPLLIAPFVGWWFNVPWTGAGLGILFEAITIEEMPLGGRIDFSAPVAAGVAAWLSCGPAALPYEASFLMGLASGWGHAHIEKRLRRTRRVHVHRLETALASGGSYNPGSEIFSALATQFALTFVFVLAIFCAAIPAAMFLEPRFPEILRGPERSATFCAPWIGAGSLAASLWRRA